MLRAFSRLGAGVAAVISGAVVGVPARSDASASVTRRVLRPVLFSNFRVFIFFCSAVRWTVGKRCRILVLFRSCSGFATFKGAVSMAFRKSGKSGNRSMTTTHDVRGANGGGRRFSMDRGKSEREFSQGASRTHALNTPQGVSQILGNPMRGGIRL
jgi:hypothetical protein